MGKIFGTDGVRGVANTELTPELCYRIGRAGAYVLTKETKHKPKIIIGKDTRVSGDMLEASLIAGMCSVGAVTYLAGVIPTPAIPFLIKEFNFDSGVMISASHNPVADNGIKFFNNLGFKLSDELEAEIEDILLDSKEILPRPIGVDIGYKKLLEDGQNRYANFLKNIIDNADFSSLKVVLDCANGATYDIAPKIFQDLGATVIPISNKPDGFNINRECGSTHIKSLCEKVKTEKADLGFAYDGDGDRCFCVDEEGNVIEGDEILSILGTTLKKNGKLKNNTIVATVMSNLGFTIMGKKENIEIVRTNVGDRYVLEEMLKSDYNLGGEQSGHIIMLDYNTTGDGILTSLWLTKILLSSKKKMSQLNNIMVVLPQALVNAKVPNNKKGVFQKDEKIAKTIKDLETKYADEGRILIRPSGTESLVRVMIEGLDKDEIKKDAAHLASVIENAYSMDTEQTKEA